MRGLRVNKALILLVLLLSLSQSLGCVRRIVTINSEPPGANVSFGHEEKGVTPTSFDFGFYGSYPVELTKDGYQKFRTTELLRAPIWEYIPFDIICELLPLRFEKRFEFTYQLEPAESKSEEDRND